MSNPNHPEGSIITITAADENGRETDQGLSGHRHLPRRRAQYIALTPDLDTPELEADIYLFRYLEEGGQSTVEENPRGRGVCPGRRCAPAGPALAARLSAGPDGSGGFLVDDLLHGQAASRLIFQGEYRAAEPAGAGRRGKAAGQLAAKQGDGLLRPMPSADSRGTGHAQVVI